MKDGDASQAKRRWSEESPGNYQLLSRYFFKNILLHCILSVLDNMRKSPVLVSIEIKSPLLP